MASSKSKTIRLYAVEEQEIYQEIYRTALSFSLLHAPFDLLGVSANGHLAALRRALSDLKPDVLLVGTKKLEVEVLEELQQVRLENPAMGLVLLLVSYDVEDLQSLRRVAVGGPGGMAVFLKQSLDQIDQLCGIVLAASQGQIVLDPSLSTFLFTERDGYNFLKQLTTRESEVLNLLARGYTNATIAEALFIDVKTVERHINSVYGKLKSETDFEQRHARVSAARLYLEATGELMSPKVPAGRPN